MLSKNKIKYIHSLEQKKYRKEYGVFLAEGHKLVGELLSKFECTYLAATNKWFQSQPSLYNLIQSKSIEFDILNEEELQRASLQKNPQEVLAIFKQPVLDSDMHNIINQHLCLGLDGIQDPGNLGTIIRIADWFGIEHIFCSTDTVDIYNPKAIQATMGAIGRVSVHYIDLPHLLSCLDKSTPVYGTFLDGTNIYQQTLCNNGLIVMGNEGNGISQEVGKFINKKLFIPNYPQDRDTSESLNVAVATAITCAEFRRRFAD